MSGYFKDDGTHRIIGMTKGIVENNSKNSVVKRGGVFHSS